MIIEVFGDHIIMIILVGDMHVDILTLNSQIVKDNKVKKHKYYYKHKNNQYRNSFKKKVIYQKLKNKKKHFI